MLPPSAERFAATPMLVLAGLVAGPQLSKRDALIVHDTVPGNPAAAELEGTR